MHYTPVYIYPKENQTEMTVDKAIGTMLDDWEVSVIRPAGSRCHIEGNEVIEWYLNKECDWDLCWSSIEDFKKKYSGDKFYKIRKEIKNKEKI